MFIWTKPDFKARPMTPSSKGLANRLGNKVKMWNFMMFLFKK